MYINKLANIIKSNNELTDKYTKEKWDEIELTLGVKLPTDYKKFINRYGVGSINDFIWVLNPFTQNSNLNLIKKGKEIREAYAISKNGFPEDFMHDVFPSSGGLLPCPYLVRNRTRVPPLENNPEIPPSSRDEGRVPIRKCLRMANNWYFMIYLYFKINLHSLITVNQIK